MSLATITQFPVGHNNPPNDAEILQSTLANKHEKLLGNAAKLIDAAMRIPDVIEDDEAAGKVGDYIKLVTGCKKTLEAERVSEKEPYLSLGRTVDGFFKKTLDLLDTSKIRAQRPLDSWLKKKAAEEQRRRLAEAEALRVKAEEEARAAKLLEDAKMQPEAEKMVEQAVITEQVAAKAEQSAQAKPAEMAQSRGSSGSLASLRTMWVGEIACPVALDIEKLRPFINPEALQKALNLFVKAGGRELRGANIYEKSETVVR